MRMEKTMSMSQLRVRRPSAVNQFDLAGSYCLSQLKTPDGEDELDSEIHTQMQTFPNSRAVGTV